MGTRSLTVIRSRWTDKEEWEINSVIYRHLDGYLDGHGQYLYDALNGLTVTNGRGTGDSTHSVNGPGRLAAYLVSQMHNDGYEPDLRGEISSCGQEYQYQIDVLYGMDGGKVSITVFDGPMTAFGMDGEDCVNEIFSGSVDEFGEFLKKQAD